MKSVPKELLERIQQMTPSGFEVIPLNWAYEAEDHDIAVFIDDQEEARAMNLSH